MTLTDIQNSLMSHFLKKETFSLSTDAKDFIIEDIPPESEEILKKEDCKRALLVTALLKMERDGFLQSVKIEGSPYDLFILTAPVETFTQDVTLRPHCIELIYSIINAYRNANGITEDKVDKSAITEKDIANLAFICQNLLNTMNEKE